MSAGMRHVRLSRDARRRGSTAFWRCGVRHTEAGATFQADAFTAQEWARLTADPMLEVSEVSQPVPTPADEDRQLSGAIAGAIADLGAADFGRDGKPNVGPVRELLPEHARAITKARVDQVFQQMLAAGFEAPQAQAPTEG